MLTLKLTSFQPTESPAGPGEQARCLRKKIIQIATNNNGWHCDDFWVIYG